MGCREGRLGAVEQTGGKLSTVALSQAPTQACAWPEAGLGSSRGRSVQALLPGGRCQRLPVTARHLTTHNEQAGLALSRPTASRLPGKGGVPPWGGQGWLVARPARSPGHWKGGRGPLQCVTSRRTCSSLCR